MAEENTQQQKKKCKFYNKGYCKHKENCKYYHPTNDCKICDNARTCRNRHRSICKYGNNCYHNKAKVCEYKHTGNDLTDVTMANNDDQQIQAHKVILAADKLNEKDDEIKKLKQEHEKEILEYKKEKKHFKSLVEDGKIKIKRGQDETKQILKDNYEIREELQTMTNQVNEQMIQMKLMMKQMEEHRDDLEKSTSEQMNNKVFKIDHGNEDIVVTDNFKCNECEFKTNWEKNYNEHKRKCKKTKKRKK